MTLDDLQKALAARRATITVKVNVGTVPVFLVTVVGQKSTGGCASTSLSDAVVTALVNYDELL